MKKIHHLFYFLYLLFYFSLAQADLPRLALGQSNILDGGPLRPQPGWYFQGYLQEYYSQKLLNGQGNPLGNVPSPTFNTLGLATQLVYQSKITLLGAKLGVTAGLPVRIFSTVSANPFDIRDSGGGVSDLGTGVFLQWFPRSQNEYPMLTHRLEMNVITPTGKYEGPSFKVNPGAGFAFIDSYWAGTLFFSPDFAISARFNYVWNDRNHTTHLLTGEAMYSNFSMEYQLAKELWVGPVGYFLRQFRNDRLNNVVIHDSCDQVLGLGPGLLYSPTKDLHLFAYVYFEDDARNRTQGTRYIARLIYYLRGV